MRWKTIAVAAALVLGTAGMTTGAMAFGHGGGFARGLAIGHGGFGHALGRGFAFRRAFALRRAFAFGGLGLRLYGWGWPYYGYGDYSYGPTDAFGDSDIVTYAAPRASSCHHSDETITVPSEDGGTRQIRMIRC